MRGSWQVTALINVSFHRIRLPEDRDPRQGQAPLFGVQFALDGDRIGVVRIGDKVMVSV